MAQHIKLLTAFLDDHFPLHGARTKCLAGFIISLLKVKTINLVQLSQVFDSKSKHQSTYRRLQHFLAEICPDQRDLAKAVASIMRFDKEEKWTLILDRTNWKFGAIHINILYLAISYKGLGIPLFFSLLEDKKRGNSDHIDRQDLMEMFVNVFGVNQIAVVLGDREFIGERWIGFLVKNKIPYIFRMKEKGQKIASSRGKMTLVRDLFHLLKGGESVSLGERRIGETNPYKGHISALRNKKGELVVVMHSEEIEDGIGCYAQRWEIEIMFKAFKSNGFNLEDTHVSDPDRLMTLLSIVSLSFCIAYRQGLLMVSETPPDKRVKKNMDFLRKASLG